MMSLMKFLKLAADPEAHVSVLQDWSQRPFANFLENQFNFPARLQEPLHALTLSSIPPGKTTTAYALPRLHRHLTSIGIFGPGFGSVIPKWGGLAEVAQVACRACAVGGGVYVLNKGVETKASRDEQTLQQSPIQRSPDSQLLTVNLQGGDSVSTRWLVGSLSDDSLRDEAKVTNQDNTLVVSRSISIVRSSLWTLFSAPAEGAPLAAGAVTVFPIRTLHDGETSFSELDLPPVYLIVHSSDTGECPAGQCKWESFDHHFASTFL